MFKIIGKYNNINPIYNTNKFEVIDSADNEAEAYRLLGEYQISFGNKWVLEIVEE